VCVCVCERARVCVCAKGGVGSMVQDDHTPLFHLVHSCNNLK
jgi:hypothetical protein